MRTLCWTAAVTLPVTIGVSALLTWAVQAAPNGDALPQTEIASCLIIDEEIFGRCAGAQPNETQTPDLRLAFDQTTPPKKGKKKKLGVNPVTRPETGVIDNNVKWQQRSQGARAATGFSGKGPSIGAPTVRQRAAPAGNISSTQDPATGTGTVLPTPPPGGTISLGGGGGGIGTVGGPVQLPPGTPPLPSPPSGGVSVSDIRLKEDIIPLMRLSNGLELYRFRYKGRDRTAYVGVMAQEVQQIEPSAVSRHPDGYLMVNYDRIGMKLMTWKEWLAPTSARSSLP